MSKTNNILERRQGKFSTILTISSNNFKIVDLKQLTKYAPFLNVIIRNKSSFDIKYYINNEKEFNYIAGGEIIQLEAEVINFMKFVNENTNNVEIILNFDNKITMLELEKLKAGVMEYGN